MPELQWRSIYKALRLMELSGEILTGYFFTGIDGPQFTSPESFRTLQKGLEKDAIFWLNACDPVSLCGIGPESLRRGLPARLPSTYLVYHGEKLTMLLKKNGRELELFVPADHPLISRYLEVCKVLLTRQFNPLNRIAVDSINGLPPGRSDYLQALRDFGFRVSHKGLELRKSI